MGELVLTPLGKQAIPVLRYRTHDLTRVVTEPCACGRTTARMQKVRARSDDMLIIRGTNVFPSQVEDVLAGIDGVTPHYRIVVESAGGLDRMTVHVELKPEAFSDSTEDMENLRRSIEDKLKGVLLVGVKAKLVEPGGIERSTGKTKHVEDLRKVEGPAWKPPGRSAPVVGRFAPSPTGRMHAGNVFAALTAWLVAKSQGGRVVLRIEDLDAERSKPVYIDAVQRDFEALGLTLGRRAILPARPHGGLPGRVRRAARARPCVPLLLHARRPARGFGAASR